MRKKLARISLLFLIFMVGCQQLEENAESTIPPADVPTLDPYIAPDLLTPQPYIAPEEPDQEPYVGPEEPTLEPYVFRKSREGMVTVHGLLFVIDPEQGMPDSNDPIFLVPLPESEGVTMMPTFEIGEVPQADVDERTGEFVFTDIEPGHYIVMVFTIGKSKIPARTEAGGFAILKIEETDRDQTIEVNYLLVP